MPVATKTSLEITAGGAKFCCQINHASNNVACVVSYLLRFWKEVIDFPVEYQLSEPGDWYYGLWYNLGGVE